MIVMPDCAGRSFHLGALSWRALLVVALLLYEHGLVKPHDLSRVNAAFFTVNGYVSVLFFAFGRPTSC